MVSCQKDDTPALPSTDITFNVSTPAPPVAASKLTKAPEISRYIIEVYNAEDLTTSVVRIEQAEGTFRVPLINNTSYTCLFWADDTAPDDNANGTFNALDLKNVTLNSGKDMEDAFFVRLDILNDETTFNVILKRPTAQVNLVELGAIAESSTIVVTHDHYNSFNALTSDVIGTSVSKDITINPTVISGTLGSYLTFAPVTGHMTDFTSLYNSTTSNNIPNVPLKANFITNIQGKYAHGSEDFTFILEIDDVWEDDETVKGVAINVGTETNPTWLRVADRNADKNGPNGAAVGSSATDYGHYYQWSNASNDPTNVDKAYSACFNFGEGNGTWRLPTTNEWEMICGSNSTDNSTRKLKFDNGEWKLYDERIGQGSNFAYFPLSGFIAHDNYGTTNTVVESGPTGDGRYWSSNELTVYPLYAEICALDHESLSSLHADDKNNGFSVRCVQDL